VVDHLHVEIGPTEFRIAEELERDDILLLRQLKRGKQGYCSWAAISLSWLPAAVWSVTIC
jgi:hypothetical protein